MKFEIADLSTLYNKLVEAKACYKHWIQTNKHHDVRLDAFNESITFWWFYEAK